MSKQLKLMNLRVNVIRLALSDKTGRHMLLKMLDAGAEGRKEASEIGRLKAKEGAK